MVNDLSGGETVGIYLFLKKREGELDATLTRLLTRIERLLFDELSIDEFERLDELYRSGVDVFREKR